MGKSKKTEQRRRRRARAKAQNSSSLVYAVYCHDGDHDIEEEGSDLHDEYGRHVENVDAHYYAIYALPLPEPVPVPRPVPFYLDPTRPPPPEKKQLKLKPLATLSLSKFPASMGFAAIGSCIYMIGGYRKSGPSLEVFIIDTSHLLSCDTPHELEPVNVPRGPRLKAPVTEPIVVSLLGKIFAIPAEFYPDGHKECAEFLDCGSGSREWQFIPSPKLASINEYYKYEYSHLHLSGAVGSCNVLGSFIVLTVAWGAVYELDAANPLEGWKVATRFSLGRMAGFSGTYEIIDGLLCSQQQLVAYEAGFSFGACYLPDDLEHSTAEFPEFIGVGHTGGWKAGGGIRPMGRRSLDMGDGRAAVLTHGFTGESQSLELHFVLDIVSIEKPQMDKHRDVVFLYPLETVDYEIGKVNTTYGCLCCCFRMSGSSKAFPTTPSVVWYDDTVAISRLKKCMRIVL